MMRVWVMIVAGLVAACGGVAEPLVVKQHTLRRAQVPEGDDPMVRGEVQRRLFGAVTPAERLDRIGQYYTVVWSDGNAGEEVEVVFEFQQAASGSAVLRRYQRFAAEAVRGRAEFEVTGEDFRRNGRVLAWRVTLLRGGRELATKRSYLWEDFP